MHQSNRPLKSDKKPRSSGERRRLKREHSFPFIDGHGYLVTEERRGSAAERRHDAK